MTEVFVDTSGFYAALDRTDLDHARAAQAFRSAVSDDWHLVTTNYIVHESMALIQARLGWAAVDAWLDHLLPLCQVVWVDESLHDLALARCRQGRQRRLSLTDCCSIQVMRQQGIKKFLGNAEHFSAEGFVQA